MQIFSPFKSTPNHKNSSCSFMHNWIYTCGQFTTTYSSVLPAKSIWASATFGHATVKYNVVGSTNICTHWMKQSENDELEQRKKKLGTAARCWSNATVSFTTWPSDIIPEHYREVSRRGPHRTCSAQRQAQVDSNNVLWPVGLSVTVCICRADGCLSKHPSKTSLSLYSSAVTLSWSQEPSFD